MSDVAFVKRQSFLRWKWKKAFDSLDILVYIVFSVNPISENTLIGYVQMEKLLLSMIFFSFFVYTALNTVSTLTFPFICWFYVHRITYFFFLWRSLVFVKCFMSTLDDLDMQNLICLNIVCFFWNYRVCTLIFPFKFCQKNSEKVIMIRQKYFVERYLYFWICHLLLIYYLTECSLMNEWK